MLPLRCLFNCSFLVLSGLGWPAWCQAVPDTFKVMVGVFSGRPDPLFVFTDSAQTRLLADRFRALDTVRVFDAGPAATCLEYGPQLSYRGLWLRWGMSTARLCSGRMSYARNPSAAEPNRCLRDPASETERLVARLGAARELVYKDGIGTLAFADVVPDSLRRPVTFDGLAIIAVGLGGSRYTGMDFSLLRRPLHNEGMRDTVLLADVSLGWEAGGMVLQAPYGIVDPGPQPGFGAYGVMTYANSRNADSLRLALRTRFDALGLSVPRQGYGPAVALQQNSHWYVARTGEAGYVAILLAQHYPMAIDRYLFYYVYTTEGAFSGATGVAAPLPHALRRGSGVHGGQVRTADLRGRKVGPGERRFGLRSDRGRDGVVRSVPLLVPSAGAGRD